MYRRIVTSQIRRLTDSAEGVKKGYLSFELSPEDEEKVFQAKETG